MKGTEPANVQGLQKGLSHTGFAWPPLRWARVHCTPYCYTTVNETALVLFILRSHW